MYRHILLPVDGSDVSDYAADEGIKLAAALGSEISFLYVVDISVATLPDAESAISNFEVIERSLREQGRKTLREQKDKAVAAGIEAKAVLVEGTVHDEILKAALEGETDLIIMGTHGRTGLNRFLLGSVADFISKRAHCPVLLVRPV
ncbi:MAG TPA: universal stress protein [Nitrospirota bacterium]